MKHRFLIGLLLTAISSVLYAAENKYDHRVTPASGGTVVVTTSDDMTFTLTPVPQDGWTFIGWDENDDGEVDGNTDNPRTVAPSTAEEHYNAIFRDDHCSPSVCVPKIVNPIGGGSVAVSAGSCSCERVLTATPAAGYIFSGWNDGNTTNPRTVTLNTGAKQNIYSAIFRLPEFTATLISGEGGEVHITFDESSCQRTITAIPSDGFEFVEWSDGITTNPRTITAAEATYEATFENHRCRFYRAKTIPMGGGTITVTNGECDCDRVLTATPDPGYLFIGWTDGNTETTRTIEIDPSQRQNIYGAIFELPKFDIVPTAGEGGTVITDYDESVCQLKVRAIPEDGWTFQQWSDGNTDNPRALTSASSYTAEFEDHRCASYYAKTLPVEGGRIQVANGTCDCDRVLTAVPDPGYFFVGWNDGNTDNPRNVEINSDKRQNIYTALFERPGYSVTTYSEDGRVIAEWDESTCQMKLYALSELGKHFEGWDDNNDGTVDNTENPRVLNSIEPRYKAIFTERRCLWYQASVFPPAEGGTVTVVQGVCDCDRLMTAIPDEGYVFTQWEDCSTTNPRNVTIDDTDKLLYNYKASFVPSDISIDAWTADRMVLTTKSEDLTPTKAVIIVDGVEIATDQIPQGEDAGIWSLPADLNDYAGQTLTVIFYDTDGKPVDALSSKVPYVATGTTKFSEIDPALPENTDIEVVSGTMTFDGDAPMVLGALTVYPNAKAVVPTGKDVTYTHIYMRGDGINNGYPQLVANGTIHNLNSDTIYYDYTLDYASFYPLAVPYDVKCEHIRTKSGKQASYEVQWYDGEERAWNGTGWTVFNDQADGATLRAGTGYIVFAVPYKWHGTRQQTVAVRFPMVANLLAGEQGPKSTTVGAYNFDDVTFPSNKNWNLVGNPYLANYTTSGDNDRMMVGYYTPGTSEADVHDYTYTDDAVRYLTYSEDGFQTYNQSRADEGVTIKSFTNFFIQSATSGALVFPLSQRAQNAPRRNVQSAPSGLSKDTKEIAFGIVLTATDKNDRTGLLYGEDFTDAYEMNADLVKMNGSTPVLELYSLAGDEKRAFNALSLSDMYRPVPVGFRNASIGEMTFRFDSEHYDASPLDAVMLTDYETGRTVNLIEEDYRFTTSVSQNDVRFVLHAVLAPRVTTDIGGTGVDGSNTNELDGVYDLLGRKVDKSMLPQGVYIIVENGEARKEVIQ